MSRIGESTVEDVALELFSGLGYTILHGPDVAPGELFAERSSYDEVVLVKRLRQALARINPKVPAEAIEEASSADPVAQAARRLTGLRLFRRSIRAATWEEAGDPRYMEHFAGMNQEDGVNWLYPDTAGIIVRALWRLDPFLHRRT